MEIASLMLAGAAAVASAVTLILNGRSTSASARSADEAARSADASEKSADAASESVEIARAERGRATERNDVHFRLNSDWDTGRVTVTNIGGGTALDVQLIFEISTFAGVARELRSSERIAPGARFNLDAFSYVEANELAVNEIDRSSAFITAGHFEVSCRVTWLSPLGTPGLAVLGEED